MVIKSIKHYGYLLIWIIGLSLSPQFGIAQAATFELLKSSSPNRSNPIPLDNATVSEENAYIFVSPQTGISQVSFYLDNPTMTGAPRQVENLAPWDFAGTGTTTSVANPFNTSSLADGTHTITAKLTLSAGGTQTISATFAKSGSAPAALIFNPTSVSFTTPAGTNPATKSVSLNTSNGSVASFSVTDNASWLTVTPASGTTPQNTVTLTVDTTGLTAGTYTAIVTATATDFTQTTLPVNLTVTGASTFGLNFSRTSNRGNPVPLTNATTSASGENIYVFVSPQTGISQTKFYLDDPAMNGAPRQVENLAPWDFAGGTTTVANPFNTALLTAGTHTITAQLTLSGGSTQVVSSTFSKGSTNAALVLNPNSVGFNTSEGTNPANSTISLNTSNGAVANFSVTDDAPWLTITPASGSTPQNAITLAVDTTGLAVGTYTATVTATATGYAAGTLNVSLTVTAAIPAALNFNPTNVNFDTPQGANPANQTVSLNSSNGSVANFALSDDESWLTVLPASGDTPQNAITLAVDTIGLAVGTYTATVTATATGYAAGTLNVSLTVNTATCPPVSPLTCTVVTPVLPYTLSWDTNEGKLFDGSALGTGFTMIQPSTHGAGYVPSLIAVVPTGTGQLQLKTTSGLFAGAVNSQDNALGIGIEASSQISVLETEMVQIPTGKGGYEQAGLWFGLDEDNVHKFVVISTPTGTRIQHLQELAGKTVGNITTTTAFTLTTTDRLLLRLRANPVTKMIAAEYSLNGGAAVAVGNFPAPLEFFNFDQAGINPLLGTRVFGGVFASNRMGPSSLTYKFDRFSVLAEPFPPPPPSTTKDGDLEFVRTSYSVPFPTSMVWAADNRLYVTEMLGKIHALSFDANQQVIGDQLITMLGKRLTLGITEDPSSTPSNVILWVSHSDPTITPTGQFSGQANSSTVSRISQSVPGSSNFDTIQHVITGLPRAVANHAINSIHFGADGRLYIAMGGNTGSGAPNTTASEFGTRAEQPLSAAFLVADVNAPNFHGVCGTVGCNTGPSSSCPLSWVQDSTGTADNTIPASCDVEVYSSGLRNMYDFVPHSNGNFYGTNNGLGVTGSFPTKSAPACTGFASTQPVPLGQNPGVQPDYLNLLIQGKYYGHPNPQRNECVFKDGSFQNVSPLPNWEPPLLDLGSNKSADGIVEYPSNVGCVGMKGNLLINNYSLGDDITRVILSTDGASVTDHFSLVGGFSDPLPITVGGTSGGTIFVGEFGTNKITSLEPSSLGCWSNKPLLPEAILDAGGTAIDDKLYVVAGKTAANGHQSKMYIYDSAASSWTQGPNLPGVGVENPATVALDGRLYVFGGATAPFSGAVSNAAVFDTNNPAAGWTSLAPMPTARSSATAQAIGGLIYVMGGMNVTGGSLNTVEIYNPSTNSWMMAPPMGTLRDNPGSAVLDGKIYIFGGRTRNSNGTTVNETLNTVEMFDPVTSLWTARAAMPTGRRTMAVGYLNGRAQVMGGEIMPDGTAFPQNEEYNPVTDSWRTLTPMSIPRHGAVAGTIGNRVYVTGGGATGGTAFTNNTSVYKF